MKRPSRIWVLVAALVIASTFIVTACVQAASVQPVEKPSNETTEDEFEWYSLDENNIANVDLHFFWSTTCPHCRVAHPFIMELPEELPWLRLHDYELGPMEANDKYVDLAAEVGQDAIYIPGFIYCGEMQTGYDAHETTGEALKQALITCQANAQIELAGGIIEEIEKEKTVSIPFIGEVLISSFSLPIFTVLIAGVDSVNPCAIFVLMFLLSLMVHAKSRWRMLLIGLVFVFFSGLIYFIIMAAWFNLWKAFGGIQIITRLAGLVAIAFAIVNIKDFFFFKQGVSLSIPDSAKPTLYSRTRNLVNADSIGAMLAGTVVLAISANAYEALCTAGFPMIYTNRLSMENLTTAQHYMYLIVYNLIYIIPLLVIVILFSFFLGSRKLGEEEGRALKLISGVMMLMLGIVLAFVPEKMSDMRVSVSLVIGSLIVAGLVVLIDRKLKRR